MSTPPPRARFLPSGREVEAEGTLFDAARAAGLPVGNACGATGTCGRCWMTVVEGGEHLSAEGALERRVKQDNRVPEGARLSCLVRVRGPVTVTAPYW